MHSTPSLGIALCYAQLSTIALPCLASCMSPAWRPAPFIMVILPSPHSVWVGWGRRVAGAVQTGLFIITVLTDQAAMVQAATVVEGAQNPHIHQWQ